MSIIPKLDKKELANLDLSPVTFTIPEIKKTSDKLEYYKQELKQLEKIKQNNIKLASKYKEIKQKYAQEKTEHNNTRRIMIKYHKELQTLNTLLNCPFLNKTINLCDCQESVKNGYCDRNYQCTTRLNTVKQLFKIP